MKNPKTTILGILTIVGGLVTYAVHAISTGSFIDSASLATVVAAFTAGLGLIHSADDTKV